MFESHFCKWLSEFDIAIVLIQVIEFGERASKKVSATRRSIKKLKAKFLNESTKAFPEGLKTKPSDFPLPKDLKLNFNPDITKSKSAEVKAFGDERKPEEEDLSKSASIYRSDVKLPPRNVLIDEPWPQPLLPPSSPQRSGAVSLPSRYLK